MNFNWALAQWRSQLLGTASWPLDQLKSPSSPGGFRLQRVVCPSLPTLERRVPAPLSRFPPRTGTWGQTLHGLAFTPRP